MKTNSFLKISTSPSETKTKNSLYRSSSQSLHDRTNTVLKASLPVSSGCHYAISASVPGKVEGIALKIPRHMMVSVICGIKGYGLWAHCSMIAKSGTDLLETKWSKKRCNPMFIAALFTKVKSWKLPKFPLTEESIKKTWHINTMEYHSAIKKEWNRASQVAQW